MSSNKLINKSSEDFAAIMSEYSDERLIEVLRQWKDYREAAVEAAVKEAIKRKIISDVSDLEKIDSLTEKTHDVSDSMQSEEETVKQIYAFAANLLLKEKKSGGEVIDELIEQGADVKHAEIVVNNLISSRNKRAKKDMLYGALWCVGGAIATMADFGYIFWGAIVFGAIQFFKGIANRS